MPLGTPGRVRSICLLSAVFCLIFLLLRGQTDMFRFLPQGPFCTLFSSFFQIWFFARIGAKRSQNGSPKTTQNHKNPQKVVIKTHPQSRHAKRLCLEGVKPLKLTIVVHFSHFFQRARDPKSEAKWDPKWSLGTPKITKNKKSEHSKKHQKTRLPKVGQKMQNGFKNGWIFGAVTDPKITTIPKILKIDKKTQKWP